MVNIAREAAQAVWGDIGHAEETVSDWFRRENPYPDTSAAPAAATATIEPTPQEESVSWVEDLRNGISGITATLEHIDAEAYGKVEEIRATPEGAEVFSVLHGLAVSEGAGPLLGIVGTMLKALVPAPAPVVAGEPQPVPSGPQVAGQA